MSGIQQAGRTVAVAVVLMACMHDAGAAQSLGGLGRAARDRLTQSAQQPAAAAAPAKANTANFTAAQLDGLAKGLVAEVASRRALAKELAALEPRADYEQCRVGFSMSDTGNRAAMAYSEAVMAYYADPQNPRLEAAMKDAQQRFEQAAAKACGPAPDDAQRLRSEKQGEPARVGAEQAGVSARQYALLKELVLPFCAVADRLEAGRDAAIPSGEGKSYAYSGADTALLKPRCGELLPLIQATL